MTSKTFSEIHDQYKALARTLALAEEKRAACKAFFDRQDPDRVIVVGCGSSYQLSQAIAASIGIHLRKAAFAIPGGDLMLHPGQYAPLFEGRPMLFLISRSGSTSEVLYALRHLKGQYPALSVFCIAATEGSEIAALSDYVMEIPWAFDESVCQTRSVTNLYAAAMLAVASAADEDEVFESYRCLAEGGEDYLASFEEQIREIGEGDFASAAVLADGEGAPVADEAALAFNEIAYTPSTFKHVLDVRHGPIVLFDKKTVVLVKAEAEGLSYQKDLVADLLGNDSDVIIISDEELPPFEGVRAQICFGKKLHPMATMAVVLPVAQLMAYYHAVAIQVNPDAPSGLDAWIKL